MSNILFWAVVLPFVSAANHYKLKLTFNGLTYCGIADSIDGHGPKYTPWLQISIREVFRGTENVSHQHRFTPFTLLELYERNSEMVFTDSAIAPIGNTREGDVENVSWISICVIHVDAVAHGYTLRICYELYKSFYFQFKLDNTIYHGTGESISGRTKTPMIKLRTVDFVDNEPPLYFSIREFRNQQLGTTTANVLTNWEIATKDKESGWEGVNKLELKWTEIRVFAIHQISLTALSYEITTYYHYKFILDGQTYYGSGEDKSSRSVITASFKILSIHEIENCSDKLTDLKIPSLVAKYQSKKEIPIHAYIANTTKPGSFVKDDISWNAILITHVSEQDSTLVMSFEFSPRCYFQFIVNDCIYHGPAEILPGTNGKTKFKILNYNKAYQSVAEFKNMMMKAGPRNVKNAGMLFTSGTATYDPNVVEWLPINIDKIEPPEGENVLLQYSPLLEKPVVVSGRAVTNANTKTEEILHLTVTVIRRTDEKLSQVTAPVGWNGELSLFLAVARSNTPISINNHGSNISGKEISIDVEGSVWILSIKRTLPGKNDLYIGIIKSKKIQKWILRTMYMGKQYFGYAELDNGNEKQNSGRSFKMTLFDNKFLPVTTEGPHILPTSANSIQTGDQTAQFIQFNSSAIAKVTEERDLFDEEMLFWSFVCLTDLKLTETEAIFYFLIPKELDYDVAMVRDPNRPRSEELQPMKLKAKVRRYVTAADTDSEIKNSLNLTGRILIEMDESIRVTIFGDNTKSIFFLRAPGAAEPWRRVIMENKYAGRANIVLGNLMPEQVYLTISGPKLNSKILVLVNIDESQRKITVHHSPECYTLNTNNKTPDKEVKWMKYIRKHKRYNFRINRIDDDFSQTEGVEINVTDKDLPLLGFSMLSKKPVLIEYDYVV